MVREAMAAGTPEVLIGPWACRSMDCQDQAVFYVDLPAVWKHADGAGRRAIAQDKWEGHFCPLHLLRVLELKIDEIPFSAALRIRRIM